MNTLALLGQQSEVAHSRGPNQVDHASNFSISRARIGLQKHPFIGATSKTILKFPHEPFGTDLFVAEKDLAFAIDGNQERVFPVRVAHLERVGGFRQVYRWAGSNHRGNYHENNQQHQHNVHHGCHVDVGIDLSALVANRDSHVSLLTSPREADTNRQTKFPKPQFDPLTLPVYPRYVPVFFFFIYALTRICSMEYIKAMESVFEI